MRSRVALAAAGVILALGAAAAVPAAGAARANGDIRLFARVAAPGEPSLTLVTPGHRVYVGTFESITASDDSASKVFEYDAHGRLLRTFVVRGQTPKAGHGVQVAARDRRGRLYLLDQAPARIVVLNPRTGGQRTYATFADLPTCAAAHRTADCSNTVLDNAPEPDYATWLPDGSLLVTDFAQQLVWRVPPGGGKARVWLSDKRLDGELFGPAGIVLMPGHRNVLMTAATGGLTTLDLADNSTRGRLYRIELTRHYRVRRFVTLWSSKAAQAPDGFAVSRDRRHLFVAMAGPVANCVVELARRHGHWGQVEQLPSTPDGIGSSPVTWDTPTSVQFLGRRILVTNQAYFTGIASHWAIFDIKVSMRGMPIYVP